MKQLLSLFVFVWISITSMAQVITITAPTMGTSYDPGDEVTFEWTYVDPMNTFSDVLLLLSTDEGVSFEPVSGLLGRDEPNYVLPVPEDAAPGTYTFVMVSPDSSVISAPLSLEVDTVEAMNDISGLISYDGNTAGVMYLLLYYQSDINVGDFENPIRTMVDASMAFPMDYDFSNLVDSTYALLSFMDYDFNMEHDEGEEPVFFLGNLALVGDTILSVYLEEEVNDSSVFVLDTVASFYYHPVQDDTGYFYPLEWGYAADSLNGWTARTMDGVIDGDSLYGMGFWVEEREVGNTNMEDDLSGSYLDAGSKLHMEYTYPSDLNINFIATGSIVTGVEIQKGVEENRLILDMEVVDPVHSASGDFGASCGISISCDPAHTGGYNAYGSVFYGDLYSHDMSVVTSNYSEMIGMGVNGEDGYEAHFTALLSDSFLINIFDFNPLNMPATSEGLTGSIPDLPEGDYTIENDAAVITSGYDVDGDGVDNKMYKVVINNANWSQHDLLFGEAAIPVALDKENAAVISILPNAIEALSTVEDLVVYDAAGIVVAQKALLTQGSTINTATWAAGLYIVSVQGEVYKFVK